jgi:hypothetical protein
MGRRLLQHLFDCTRDAEERDVACEESGYCNLVGGVERDAGSRAGGCRLIG